MNDILEILVFNVGQAQCVFFYPQSHPEYGMFIDCAESDTFTPIDFLIQKNLIYWNTVNKRYELGNFTVTNYDHDHFSGLPKIREKIYIKTVWLPKNISSQKLKEIKEEVTDALNHLCDLKDTYVHDAIDHNPPYRQFSYSLEQGDLESPEINTNHLSQIVFVEYGGSKICICGDLEKPAWEKLLQKQKVQNHLKSTNIVIAAHHGHDNGYHEDIFLHCLNPDCIVISDKDIMYDTQNGMASTYSQHVQTGVNFNGANTPRKVLTTRSDGHLWIRFYTNGVRTYHSLSIKK